MKNLDYQIRAIEKLQKNANELLELNNNHTLIFKAPTGSGKTIMIAEFIKDFISNNQHDKEFSFIWAAPRKLHTQSKEKLTKHYSESMSIKCSNFDNLSNRKIEANEILFLNWESINKEKNIYYRENEQEFYLEKILENTVADDKELILIIDESHHTAGSEKSQELINLINAKLSIAVSATPNVSGETVTVHREHVIQEGMIKKNISINPDFKNSILNHSPSGKIKVKSKAEESTTELVIRKAIEKRNILCEKLVKEDSNVNPLILIQLPDRRHDENIMNEIIDILKRNHSINLENNKLAIYLSENKKNLDTIIKNQNPVEVMIFKQAISLGWDCPRASILILFRDWKSITFSVQTIGRIMRMPELKHYHSEELNVGYIYTNLNDISIHQDIADGYAIIYNSQRNDEIYTKLELLSCHSKRNREKTRLNPEFIKFFLKSADDYKLKEKLSIDIDDITNQLITDGLIENLDSEEIETDQIVDKKLNEEEIQKYFDQFSREQLSPFHPEERSIGRINKSIYEFFKINFILQFEYAGLDIQKIVLSKLNQQFFIDVINIAKERYINSIDTDNKEIVFDKNWEIPRSINYSIDYIKNDYELSITKPFYEDIKASEVEKNFSNFLDSKKNEIIWWFKNGNRDGTFFAIPRHNKDNDLVPFYVDWIVYYKDGRIGLFETKGGITAETSESRAIGLYEYIRKQTKEGKNIFGGIVIEKDGTFWIHSEKEYKYNENDLENCGWKVLC